MATKKPHDQLRRGNVRVSRVLPPDGPSEPTPDWPLGVQWPGEQERWEMVWRRPIAQLWHEIRCYEPVAMWVRLAVKAEALDGSPGTGAAHQTQVRLYAESLGVTPKAMHVMGLHVGQIEPEPVRDLDFYREAVGGTDR